MKRILILLTATALLWIAQISSASACFSHFYEPELPESLNE
ncbi:cyclic lactone autoinducer peptide [Desulfotruncus alcoholivorax]